MDCFYAAIEVRDQPHLRGKPVAVGGNPNGRGVVATASYEARKFGVRSAMSSAQALRLCPDLVFIRSNFEKYREASQQIHRIFREATDIIEPLSLDEAFLDVSANTDFSGSATLLAEHIRKRIYEETQLTASAGIAPNKFLAKIASDWKKPNGQFTIAPQDVANFVLDLPVRKIPGVGKVTARKMHLKGLKTCSDLQKLEVHELTRLYGSWGERLYKICRGIDDRSLSTHRTRKSLSVERTYSEDFQSIEKCLEQIPHLYEDFRGRFEKIKERYLIKGLFVKVKFNDFTATTLERSEFKFPGETAFSTLLREALGRAEKPVRLLGVGARLLPKEETKPKDSAQLELTPEAF